jgi:uncharacterized protein
MNLLIDRRLNGRNRSAVNRERFIRRYKERIQESVAEAIGRRSIKDLDRGERIDIPRKDIAEPQFHHGPGGRREAVHPGNREYIAGDHLPRPPGGAGRGSKASDSGEGEDAFTFVLSREEFLRFFFDDLALPDLVKTKLAQIADFKSVRAGYTTSGVPTNINIVRSLRGAAARRRALQAPQQSRLRAVEAELAALPPDAPSGTRLALEEEIQRLRRRIEAVPFIDTFDLRFNNRIRLPRPSTQAVMFCLMDVSGSMDESRKDLAKRFFALLYLFLSRAYERMHVVFIRHHTQASEVGEEEFFSARDTGGTVVSSALKLMQQIISDRYPAGDWNLYAAQASDGDNWMDDSPRCAELLADHLLPQLQYFAYVQVGVELEQGLWQEYAKLAAGWPSFALQKITSPGDIYPVFRELFQRKPA